MIINPFLYYKSSKKGKQKLFVLEFERLTARSDTCIEKPNIVGKNKSWILYFLLVENTLRGKGLYTDSERTIVRNLKKKFLLVILVFYVW